MAKSKDCPLCGGLVESKGEEDGAAAMNRHFERDCPWRHTGKPPGMRKNR